MAFMVKNKRKQEEYANYEQQAPERDIYYRQADMNSQQPYEVPYQNYEFSTQYTQQPYGYQQNGTPRFVSSYYQEQVDRYLSGGQMRYQNNYNRNGGFVSPQDQYKYDMYMGETYDRNAQVRRANDQRRSGKMKKKNVNSDMIKIVVTIMVVAVLICGLLIANQFMSSKEASAESDIIQPVDSVVVASASTADGSEVMQSIEMIPEYQYEQSTNWFDKICDFFGGKLN